jgi:hypothetical protein
MKKSAMALATFLLIGLAGLATSWAAVTVTINNPANNSRFLEGETIFLQGSGTVTPSGAAVPGNDLEWRVNNAFIGNGEFQTLTLSAGGYRITLIGDVEGGGVGVDEILITVLSQADLTVTVNIVSPAAGQQYDSGDLILFVGTGEITGTGARSLSGNELQWFSDRDGLIGTGTSFTRRDLSPGEHLITLVGGGRAIDTITITINSVSIFVPEPITSGDFSFYDWGKNVLYVPLLIGDTSYFLNFAVTNWTTNPIQLSLRYIGINEFSPTAEYADFDVLSNTLFVPDFRVGAVSYMLILKLTTNEDPFVFTLVGSIQNR